MADQGQKATTREVFAGALLCHDWTACFSDDYRVSKRSDEHFAANIQPFIEQFPQEWEDLRWPADQDFAAWRERQRRYVAEIKWMGKVE